MAFKYLAQETNMISLDLVFLTFIEELDNLINIRPVNSLKISRPNENNLIVI